MMFSFKMFKEMAYLPFDSQVLKFGSTRVKRVLGSKVLLSGIILKNYFDRVIIHNNVWLIYNLEAI